MEDQTFAAKIKEIRDVEKKLVELLTQQDEEETEIQQVKKSKNQIGNLLKHFYAIVTSSKKYRL